MKLSMSKREITLYVVDIFIAINKLNRYTSKFTDAETFKWSELEWDASIRELEIIGEATKILIHSDILSNDKYRKIVDFRNIISHGYFGIDEEEVFIIIKEKLAILSDDLIELIKHKNISIKEAISLAIEENILNKKLTDFLNDLQNKVH
jgi:uncharacterized protein with HEPN domain